MKRFKVDDLFSSNIKSRKLRKGVAAVEFAVVAPLLVLLMLGIIEFGRAMMVRQALVDSARAGCRVAILQSATNQDALDTISTTMSSIGVSNYTVTFTPNPASSAAEFQPVTVTVDTSFNDAGWLPLPQFLGNTVLSGSSTMARE